MARSEPSINTSKGQARMHYQFAAVQILKIRYFFISLIIEDNNKDQ
jgi:hypothetical protein